MMFEADEDLEIAELLNDALRRRVICEKDILAANEEDQTGLTSTGFCLSCGLSQQGHEPDAAGNECESCGEKKVCGAHELLLHLLF